MPAKKDNLSILIPDASVETSIGTFLLRPFRFKDSKTALGLIKHYASILFDDVEDKDADGEPFKRAKTTAEIINCVLEEDGEDYPVLEDIAKLLKLACNTLDPDKVGELGYDDVFLLLAEIIQQNRDFFQRLMTKINPPKEDKEATPTQKTMASESAA